MNSYILKGTENEYLLVIRTDDESLVHKVVDELAASKNDQIQLLAADLGKSLYVDGRSISKVNPKGQSKVAKSNRNKGK